jgi:hypothetical protein
VAPAEGEDSIACCNMLELSRVPMSKIIGTTHPTKHDAGSADRIGAAT